MLELLVLGALASAATIFFFRELWGNSLRPPEHLLETGLLSDLDRQRVEQTRQILVEFLGCDAVFTVSKMDAVQRIQTAQNLVEGLIRAYELDTQVCFFGDQRSYCGYYSFQEDKLYLNVADLLENDDAKLTDSLRNFLDTVVHELRHAVQHKAVRIEGFWNVDDKRRLQWAENIAHYVSPGVNLNAYIAQSIERDARTFADESLKGVFS